MRAAKIITIMLVFKIMMVIKDKRTTKIDTVITVSKDRSTE
jgi:hypothetical protein